MWPHRGRGTDGGGLILAVDQRATAPAATEDSLLSLVKRRTKPRVILLNDDLSIAFAEADATAFLMGLMEFPEARISRLPAALERSVRDVLKLWDDQGAEDEQVTAPLPNTIMRVSRLHGPTGSFIAAFVEEHQRREDLAGAAIRFRLTRREVQVLELILGGHSAVQIAQRLEIAETTVADYFKNLQRKTGAKNRADMLAKVLGWDDTAVSARAARQAGAPVTDGVTGFAAS